MALSTIKSMPTPHGQADPRHLFNSRATSSTSAAVEGLFNLRAGGRGLLPEQTLRCQRTLSFVLTRVTKRPGCLPNWVYPSLEPQRAMQKLFEGNGSAAICI